MAPDSYGLLFVLVSASILVTPWSDSTAGTVVAVVIQGAAMIFALITSRASTITVRIASGALFVGVISAFVASTLGGSAALTLTSAIRVTLTLAALGAIAHRLLTHLDVSGETLMGALCMYLLLGLLFTGLYGLIEGIKGSAFFVQANRDSWLDRTYFSFVTMTTVGYGDLTASSDVGRIVAITEALAGQLYLVSVVAVVVGNLGRRREPPGSS
jgi:hypothetical protein